MVYVEYFLFNSDNDSLHGYVSVHDQPTIRDVIAMLRVCGVPVDLYSTVDVFVDDIVVPF